MDHKTKKQYQYHVNQCVNKIFNQKFKGNTSNSEKKRMILMEIIKLLNITHNISQLHIIDLINSVSLNDNSLLLKSKIDDAHSDNGNSANGNSDDDNSDDEHSDNFDNDDNNENSSNFNNMLSYDNGFLDLSINQETENNKLGLYSFGDDDDLNDNDSNDDLNDNDSNDDLNDNDSNDDLDDNDSNHDLDDNDSNDDSNNNSNDDESYESDIHSQHDISDMMQFKDNTQLALNESGNQCLARVRTVHNKHFIKEINNISPYWYYRDEEGYSYGHQCKKPRVAGKKCCSMHQPKYDLSTISLVTEKPLELIKFEKEQAEAEAQAKAQAKAKAKAEAESDTDNEEQSENNDSEEEEGQDSQLESDEEQSNDEQSDSEGSKFELTMKRVKIKNKGTFLICKETNEIFTLEDRDLVGEIIAGKYIFK